MLPIKDNNPTTITPWVTYGLIAVNVVVFLLTVSLAPQSQFQVNLQYGAIPAVRACPVTPAACDFSTGL